MVHQKAAIEEIMLIKAIKSNSRSIEKYLLNRNRLVFMTIQLYESFWRNYLSDFGTLNIKRLVLCSETKKLLKEKQSLSQAAPVALD